MPTNRTSTATEERSPENKRQFERADYQVEVTLESESNFYNGFTENISAGGLFVATYDLRELGDKLTMQFTIPGFDKPVEVRGEVRWIRDLNPLTPDMTPGMGVRFLDLTPEAEEAIRRFTAHKDPLFYDDE